MEIRITHNLSHLGFENYDIDKDGNVYNIRKNIKLKPYKNKKGYYVVKLYNKKKLKNKTKSKDKTIHKLLAECYILNPKNKKCIDHIDRNTINNNLNNLRWVTHQENMMNKRKYKNGVNNKNIYKYEYGWRVLIRRNNKAIVCKKFKKLEDAIEYRDEQLELL